MQDTITVSGVVGTVPRSITTTQGTQIVSFRLAASQRRFDRTSQTWVDGDTNWYSVSCFRRLADNARTSVQKGDRLLVAGRLRIREWENAEKSGTSVEIDADALGHDLGWGTSTFVRTLQAVEAPAAASPDAWEA